MKRLLLLRHAKSDWHASHGTDHDRPLNPRGEGAARAVGRFLRDVDQVPERILTSSALRARSTVELAAEEGGWGSEVRILPELYHSSPHSVIELLHKQGGEESSLLLAGHQPTFSELASQLLGGAEVKMVTAALARLDLAIHRWSELRPGSAVLAWLVTPKLLQKGQLT